MLTCSRVSLARNGTVKRELGFAGLSRHLGAAVLLPALNAALAGALPCRKGALCDAGFEGLFPFSPLCPSTPG